MYTQWQKRRWACSIKRGMFEPARASLPSFSSSFSILSLFFHLAKLAPTELLYTMGKKKGENQLLLSHSFSPLLQIKTREKERDSQRVVQTCVLEGGLRCCIPST